MNSELTILLVEDDPDAQANLVDILALDGHQTKVAGSFAEAREINVAKEFDLVILDRRLPDGNVEDTLPELVQIFPRAEFIVVTGFAEIESTIAAFRLGVADYMLKPVHPEVVRQRVARIAQQKQSEQQMRQEQRFINQILETSEAFIVVLDLQARVVRFNTHFTTVTGWKLDDMVGKDYIDHCIPEPERHRIHEVFRETAAGKHSTGVRNGVLTTDGRIRQVRWSDSTLTDEHGKITSVLAIGVDVTEVIEAQDRSARDQRLAAIGQTVAGLAHESRNALHRINASVDLLRMDIPIDSESREEVDSIARASAELQSTLEEVRQYAAPIHLHREPVYLHEVWRRVWGYLTGAHCQRDAKLIESECGCLVDVDVLRMEQVFRNLFENALAACSDPVRIRIDCTYDGEDEILVTIEDNGPGLDQTQRENVFDPFFTTKAQGTGLGMSIVQRTVEAHGGDIHVVDADGRGAKFKMRLSKSASPHPTPRPSSTVNSEDGWGIADG